MKSRKGCVIGTALYNEKYGKSKGKTSPYKQVADDGSNPKVPKPTSKTSETDAPDVKTIDDPELSL